MGRPSAVLIVMVWVVGCEEAAAPTPTWLYEPVAVGVVESTSEVFGGGLAVRIENGRTLEFGTHPVELYGGLPTAGRLLLVAQSGTSHAYATLRLRTDDCYNLVEPGVEHGDQIVFGSLFTLPKSADFDPGPIRNGDFPSVGEGFCVNATGEVTRYGHHPSDVEASLRIGASG